MIFFFIFLLIIKGTYIMNKSPYFIITLSLFTLFVNLISIIIINYKFRFFRTINNIMSKNTLSFFEIGKLEKFVYHYYHYI